MKNFIIILFTVYCSLLTVNQLNAQWEWQNPLPHGNSLSDVDFVSDLEGWASGGSIIMHTIDGGNTWETQYRLEIYGYPWSHIEGICFTDSEKGWAVGYVTNGETYSEGKIWYTSDGGDTWEVQFSICVPPFFFNSLWNITFTDQENGWAIGERILHTSNGGDTWQTQYIAGISYKGVYFAMQIMDGPLVILVPLCILQMEEIHGKNSPAERMPIYRVFSFRI